MEEVKSKNNVVLIIIIILLLAVVIGLGGYIFLNKNNPKETEHIIGNNEVNVENESMQENLETKNDEQESEENSVIVFNGSKSINSNQKDYTLACQGNAGIWVTVDSNQKTLLFSFTPTKVVNFYQLNWVSSKDDMKISKINFDKKIVDIIFGGIGQSASGDTLFILLEDGTVEYIPIVHMFNNAQAEVISYGRINGVNDVVKFALSNTSDGVTTLAIKQDGSFYDLWYALKDTGNY